MKRSIWISLLAGVGGLALPLHGAAQDHGHGAQAGGAAGEEHRHGVVTFETSCAPEAHARFTTGLALLHHMMYDQAEVEFNAAAEKDPACAMAHWGVAMSIIHPLWGERPRDEAFRKGAAALARAKEIGAPTDRERAYIAALEPFYTAWAETPYPAQLEAFEAGFAQVSQAYPEDVEAGAFHGLAMLATAPKSDRTFARQQQAGMLLESLHGRAPEHPGLFHYVIHAYDNPALASRAVEVARGYDRLAPEVPHALHMPSHIFIRLGLWEDAASWNARSAAAALRQPVGDHTSMHYAHALDYLVYAGLQRAQDEAAEEIAGRLAAVANFQPGLAAAYAVAAVPARLALERRDWQRAASLAPAATFSWEAFPNAEAITHFARALGAARLGDEAKVNDAIATLDRLHGRLTEAGESYWASLVDAQRKTVQAWMAHASGDTEEAIALMKAAADAEDALDKHPVTPGAVLPARELYGEMLLLAGRADEALEAYETSLRISPNRLNALLGAGRAAVLAGDPDRAAAFYTQAVSQAGDGEREGLEEARTFAAEDE